MKYVRNMDDVKRFTFEFFDSFLPEKLSDKMVNYFLLDLGDKAKLECQVLEVMKSHPLDKNTTAEFGEVILQLKDFKELLKKFVEMLLKSQSFEQLSAFLNRIFLQQIGENKYHSSRKTYSINERYFDKFIEIIDYCEISKELYTPFFWAIFNCDNNSLMFFYKEPLKEYLDIYLKDSDDDKFVSGLLGSDNRVGFNEYVSTNTVKTVRTLISEYVKKEINNSSLLKQAISNQKQEGFNIIEEYLDDKDSNIRFRAIMLLLLFKEDRPVKDRLKYIYENTKDEKIKDYLEKECGFNSLQKFASQEEFFEFVDKSVKQIQERLYGARLKRYYEKYKLDNTGINGKLLTYIMDFFKTSKTDMQLSVLREYFKYVDNELLEALCNVVYEVATHREKLLGSKWALRFISVFGSSDLIWEITEQLKEWFLDKKACSTCKYFLNLLSECGREEIIEVAKELLQLDLDNKHKKFLLGKLECFSQKSKQNIEEVKDKLVEDYGFNNDGSLVLDLESKKLRLQINLDCTISIYNDKTNKPARIRKGDTFRGGDIKLIIKRLEKIVKSQRKRLYSAFLEFRNYDIQNFEECIVENNLLNFLAQNLFWARYKNDKVAEICVLEDNKLKHVAGNLILENFEDYKIAILQPMDCVDVKERLKDKMETLFDQFELPVFLPQDLPQNSNCIDSLGGIFCNAQLFITRLQKMKYKINDLDSEKRFGMLVKENKNLNLLTAVEFDRVPINHLNCSTTLSRVTFYNLKKQTKTGKIYNLNKADALIVKSMNPRILSNELALILNACKA